MPDNRNHTLTANSGTATMKVVVDPDGDVLLVVGATQPNVSIQVSSKVLSLASKPFKVMFSQSFREGNELVVSNGPYEISLPDDDPDAMVTICKLIHHKDVAPEGSIVAMRSFSVATDKYDTLQACSLYGRAWLDLFCHNAEQRGAGTLSLAHLFQDCGNFKKVSRALLARPQGIAQLRAVPEDATSIPESVIDALMTLRSSIEDHLSENLQMPITKMVTEHTQNLVLRGNCNHQSTQVCDYISELRRLHLWPVQPKHWDFDEVLSDLSEFRNESTSKKKLSLYDKYCQCCRACRFPIDDHIAKLRKYLLMRTGGLCLACVLAGDSQGGKVCHKKH